MAVPGTWKSRKHYIKISCTLLLALLLTTCGELPITETLNQLPVRTSTSSVTSAASPSPSQTTVSTLSPSAPPTSDASPVSTELTPFRVTTYVGHLLPTPSTPHPAFGWPAAWLVVDGNVIEAAYGGHGTTNMLPSATFLNALLKVHLTTTVTPVVVIGAGPIESVSAIISSWQNDPAQQNTNDQQRLSVQPDIHNPTAFMLAPVPETKDQLLHIFVRFGPTIGGDATYLWHLSPQK